MTRTETKSGEKRALKTKAQLIATEHWWLPLEVFRMYPPPALRFGFLMFLQNGVIKANDMLTLVVFE